ncbi:MAG: hypothetical protein ABJF65_00360 [Reichenbachiella sp.]|uniref:hypothetical protein n=1 Tax=Reichenbachiella sp. TaxID=2184521 RepID=UPI00326572F7
MSFSSPNPLESLLEETTSKLEEQIASSPEITLHTLQRNSSYYKAYDKACMLLALVGINEPTALETDQATKVLSEFHQIHFPHSTLEIAI